MKVVMIGTERRLFDEKSSARARIIMYGSLVEELHIIALTVGSGMPTISLAPNIWLYPTNSVSRFFYIFDAVKVGKKLKGKGISLVSAQDPFESGFAARRLARKLRAKFHLQIHTDIFSPYFGEESILNQVRISIARYLLPKAHAVRVVSKKIADSITASGVRLKKEAVVLPVFVDIQKFITAPPSRALNEAFPQFDTYVLMVARLEREKNFPLALEAFARIAYKHDAGLIIIGSGSILLQLQSLARNLNITERVKFVGWQDSSVEEYKSASVLLFTSNYEGYGMALVEAAASGLPIVTTDVGIAREFFGDAGAYISPVADVEALTAHLDHALSNPDVRKQKALIASESVKKAIGNEAEYLQQYKLAWEKAL